MFLDKVPECLKLLLEPDDVLWQIFMEKVLWETGLQALVATRYSAKKKKRHKC